MKQFPPHIQFEFPWRNYQARVLRELEAHLDDNHLNIVAAPGSGKTILGLEVMLRINKPTLILAPSIAIRNQWVNRFLEHFLRVGQSPDWISTNIRKPKLLTVSTYQGLHAAFSGKDEANQEASEEEFNAEDGGEAHEDSETEKTLALLKEQNIQTLVIDEAHHLRNEWWKSLTVLKNNIQKPHVVALTATPPYDVTPEEWKNYQALCGPIDAEIPVPELVEAGNLCPHQDYIYINHLSAREELEAKKFKKGVLELIRSLKQNSELIEKIKHHPCLERPEENIEVILKHPDYFSSVVIFLKSCDAHERIGRDFFRILGARKKDIPRFKLEWAEIMLDNIIYKDDYFQDNHKPFLNELKRELSRHGCIEKRRIYLKENKRIKSLMKESLNKLNSIVEIVRAEKKNLKEQLRMVILTDYIRKEALPRKNETLRPPNRIGVVPIFEQIRRTCPAIKKLGILSGSLVIIPLDAKASLKKMSLNLNIPLQDLKITPLDHDPNHLKITIRDKSKSKMVQLITHLFTEGEIEVLVGTKALLGEGWDAPSINSLILASFVGSFMLSNQMRGRAIRIDKTQPNKVSNIWHLVTVEKNKSALLTEWVNSIEESDFKGGHDYKRIKRRFRAFVGVSFKEKSIENGIERMDLGLPPFSPRDINRLNQKTLRLAGQRNALAERWREILKAGEIKKIISEIETEKEALPRPLVFKNTIKALIAQAILVGTAIFFQGLQAALESESDLRGILLIISLSFALGALLFLTKSSKALYLMLKHGSLGGSFKQIGTVVLKTLCRMNEIKTDVNRLNVKTQHSKQGVLFCHLEGGTSYEKSLFLESLEAVLDPIENPRYIVARKGMFWRFQTEDFHAVPDLIGTKKKWALYFSQLWKKYVSDNDLIYTRNLKGRSLLLNARKNAMSRRFQKRSERRDQWK